MALVKICGITNRGDALMAAGAGADAIGVVNVRKSKRFTELETARDIFNSLPTSVLKVVVVSPENLDEVKKVEETNADYIQLHGEESPEFIREIRENSGLKMKIIKQISVVGEGSIEQAGIYSRLADAILLDTSVKGLVGGTGRTHDWEISRRIVKLSNGPVILAGGLNPENVADAIKKVNPYAVDAASGVESEPGIKDPKKVKEFIRIAKNVSV